MYIDNLSICLYTQQAHVCSKAVLNTDLGVYVALQVRISCNLFGCEQVNYSERITLGESMVKEDNSGIIFLCQSQAKQWDKPGFLCSARPKLP